MNRAQNKCFIDSSAFIALNHAADQNHERACRIAQHLTGCTFVVSDCILTETYTILRYRLGFQIANRFLNTVLHSEEYEIVEVNRSMRLQVLDLLERFSDQKISYCDALSVVIMNEQKITDAFAFDYHFAVLGVKSLDV